MIIKVYRLNKGNPVPTYMSESASGMDLYASLEHPVDILPGRYSLIPAGVVVSLPAGYEAQVRPRSGLALRHGVTVLNAPGTIDRDYRGEIKVLLINHGTEVFTVENGMRIAQMVIARVERVDVVEVECLDDIDSTMRSSGGFGHTGL